MQEGVGYGSDYDIAARAANRSTIEYLNCSQRRGSSVLLADAGCDRNVQYGPIARSIQHLFSLNIFCLNVDASNRVSKSVIDIHIFYKFDDVP